MTETEPVRIVDFERRHAAAFRDLNLAWIRARFPVEVEDERQLADPHGVIISPGGHVLLAVVGERVVGSCALIVRGPGELELAKFTVADDMRGAGIGQALLDAAVQRARKRGMNRMVLFSHTKLSAAVRLFRRCGFVEAASIRAPYEQVNLVMVLELCAG